MKMLSFKGWGEAWTIPPARLGVTGRTPGEVSGSLGSKGDGEASEEPL